jgi:hypothetical protein
MHFEDGGTICPGGTSNISQWCKPPPANFHDAPASEPQRHPAQVHDPPCRKTRSRLAVLDEFLELVDCARRMCL